MRIILIDNYSGYIWGDSADFFSRIFRADDVLAIDPDSDLSEESFAKAFALALDKEINGEGRGVYTAKLRPGREYISGYSAYRADVDGKEVVATIHDGTDRSIIEAVTNDCKPVCFVAIRKP